MGSGAAPLAEQRRAGIELNIAVVLFGMTGLLVKMIDMPAIGVAFGRVVASSLALLVFALLTKRRIRVLPRRDRWLLVAAGVTMAVHWICFNTSIQVSTVAIGTVTYSSFPLFLTFLEPLVFRTRIRPGNVLMSVLILAGVLITVPEFSLQNRMALGVAVGMLASLTFAFVMLFNEALTKRQDGAVITLWEQGTAAVVLLPFSFFMDFHFTPRNIGLLVILGVLLTAFAYSLYVESMKKIPAQIAGICASLETVYAIVFAWLLLGEVPTWHEIAGAVIIIGTVMAAQFLGGKEKPAPAPGEEERVTPSER